MYFVVHDWMIKNLELKGVELLIYAVIHGFSKDSQGVFHGSSEYLSENTGADKKTCLRVLKKLVTKGFLRKEVINNHPCYCVVTKNHPNGDKKSPEVVTKNHPNGDKKSPNNIDILNNDNIDNIKEKKSEKKELFTLLEIFNKTHNKNISIGITNEVPLIRINTFITKIAKSEKREYTEVATEFMNKALLKFQLQKQCNNGDFIGKLSTYNSSKLKIWEYDTHLNNGVKKSNLGGFVSSSRVRF